MNKRKPQFPLAGGDYIQDANGPRQVAKPTAPPPGKSAKPRDKPERANTTSADAPAPRK